MSYPLRCDPIAIGVNDDHVHVLCRLDGECTVVDLVRAMKSASATVFNKTHADRTLRWQAGYGHFSVSPWDVPCLASYVREQRHRHAKRSVIEMYEAVLQK